MTYRKLAGGILAASVAWLVVLAPAEPAIAQDGGGLIQVAEVQVKMDRVGEFIDLQQQMAEAARAEGRSGTSVWQAAHGRMNMFHIVSGRDNFAAYDEGMDPPMSGEEWARWVGRILQTIESRTVMTLRLYPDLVIPRGEDQERNLARLRITTVKPGMNDEYEEWIRDKLMPALREGGQTGVSWQKVVTGGNPSTWFGVTEYSSFAQMDPPGPLDYMNERRRASMLDEAWSMTSGAKILVMRYRADLSY
ncbi:MAG TPA: hypothetical protein VIS73_12265 [Rhodocyclaceae bacterium]